MFTKFVIVIIAIICQVTAGPVDSIRPLITNGEKATEATEFPYIASLEYYGLLVCTGVIIRPNVVLTTAHCTEGFSKELLVVRAGTLIREDKSGRQVQVRKVRNTAIHPNFKAESGLDNDVSLIYLDRDFELNEYVNVIDLATGEDFVGTDAVIMGWGKDEHFEETDNLMIGTVSLISNEKCSTAYKGKQTIPDSVICGTSSDRQVICEDDGSPMVIHYSENPKMDKLIGLASHSEVKRIYKNHLKGAGPLVKKTCDTSMPSIFTRISAVTQWILSKL